MNDRAESIKKITDLIARGKELQGAAQGADVHQPRGPAAGGGAKGNRGIVEGGARSAVGHPTADHLAVAQRAKSIAGAIQAGLGPRRQGAEQKSVALPSQRVQILAQGSKRHPSGMGANIAVRPSPVPVKSAPVGKAFPMTISVKGRPVTIAAKRYGKGPSKIPSSTSIPIVRGSTYRGSKLEEYEYHDQRGRHVRAIGHILLCEIVCGPSASPAVGEGNRLAVILINPAAIGGRVAQLATQFEQSEAKRLAVCYRPSVPATQAGALAMYFRNDISSPTLETGVDELTHASTHPAFVQFAVYEDREIDIRPSDSLLKYFNQDSGEFRQEIQGYVTVESASTLDTSRAYGNLYLEYDIDFYGEELDYDVAEISTGAFKVSYNYDGTAELDPYDFVCVAAGGAADLQARFLSGGADHANILLYGVVCNVLGDPLVFTTADSGEILTIQEGQGIWVRFKQLVAGTTSFIDSSISACPFVDLASAGAFNEYTAGAAPDAGDSAGSGRMLKTLAPCTGSFQINFRIWDLQ